jgi:hypothetical protein
MHRAQKLCNVVVGGICISSVTLCHFVAPRKPCSTNSCTTWALIFILPSGMGVVTMIPSIAPEFSQCRLSVDMLPDRPSGMSCPRQKYSSANKLRTPFVDARRVPPSQSRNHDKCLISVIAWRARLVTTADALRGTRSPGSCLNLGGGPPTCGASGSTVSITRRVSPATMDAEPRQDTPLSGPARIRLRALLKDENSETRFPHDRVHASSATPSASVFACSPHRMHPSSPAFRLVPMLAHIRREQGTTQPASQLVLQEGGQCLYHRSVFKYTSGVVHQPVAPLVPPCQ